MKPSPLSSYSNFYESEEKKYKSKLQQAKSEANILWTENDEN